MMVRKSLAAMLAAVSFSGVQASSAWKDAVSGDWMLGSNWLDGSVPSYSSGETVYITNTLAAYTVGLSNTTEQVIGGLLISGTSSTLPAHLAIEDAALKVSGGRTVLTNGEICVGAGSVFEMTGGRTDLAAGGRIIVDGGDLIATNNFQQCYMDSASNYNGGRYPLIKINSGNAYFKYTSRVSTGIILDCVNYSQIQMSGGVLTVDSDHKTTGALRFSSNSDTGTTLEMSGNSLLRILNGTAAFGRGVVTLRDNASIEFSGNDQNHCSLQPYFSDSGKKMTMNLMDNSSFKVSMAKFYLGRTDARSVNTVGKLNISGGNHSFGRYCELGCGHGTFTTTITGGHTEFTQYGLRIGAYPNSPSATDQASRKIYTCTGTVDVVGGVLYLNPTECHNDSPRKALWGTVVGYGKSAELSGWFDGRLNISGEAIVTNGPAPLIVGAGNAVGSVTQTGGELYSVTDGRSFSYWSRSAMVLGLCGGRGSYSISAGSCDYGNMVFVGGVDMETLNRPDAQNNMPANDGSSVGLLEITGGSFRARKSLHVGNLGRGTVHVSGSGSLTVDMNLVLSNSVAEASLLKLTVAGDIPPSVSVAGSLIVSEGAKLEVDVSDFATTNVWTKLVSCSSRNGDFAAEDVKVVGEGVRGSLVFDRASDGTGSIWWYRPKGTTVVLR